jgi:hypothetical protein
LHLKGRRRRFHSRDPIPPVKCFLPQRHLGPRIATFPSPTERCTAQSSIVGPSIPLLSAAGQVPGKGSRQGRRHSRPYGNREKPYDTRSGDCGCLLGRALPAASGQARPTVSGAQFTRCPSPLERLLFMFIQCVFNYLCLIIYSYILYFNYNISISRPTDEP